MTKGERIKQLRIAKNITQEDFAKSLKTTKQTVSKYETGIVTNIPSDKIEEMSEILGTTPDYILGWEKIEKNNDTIASIVVRLRSDEVFFDVVSSELPLGGKDLELTKHFLSALLKDS